MHVDRTIAVIEVEKFCQIVIFKKTISIIAIVCRTLAVVLVEDGVETFLQSIAIFGCLRVVGVEPRNLTRVGRGELFGGKSLD